MFGGSLPAMAESASEDAQEPASDDTAETQSDDTAENKRKFREALQRKQTKSAAGAAHHGGGGAQSRAHGPAGNRREFRRKSGG